MVLLRCIALLQTVRFLC